MKVMIGLATYNGAPWLAEQLASIQNQRYTQWHLLARDDGSTDTTRAILEEFAAQDRRIEVLPASDNACQPRGAVQNFGQLLTEAQARGADWVLLADQDDVWHPEKISRSLELGIDLADSQPSRPVLVHTDLEVVNDQLETIHRSFLEYSKIRHEVNHPLRTLLVQNYVTGCTCLINRALLQAALPIPTDATMHDWWLALVAAACGEIGFISSPMVRYRQHRRNQIGAKNYWGSVNPLRKLWRLHSAGASEQIGRLVKQVRALAARLAELEGTPQAGRRADAVLVDDFVRLFAPHTTAWARLYGLTRLRVGRQDWLRNQYLRLRMLTLPGLTG